MQLNFPATLDRDTASRRLDRLLVSGALVDRSLGRRIERLGDAFRSYAASYPLPLWAPHLLVTPEMRALTETLFPLKEVRCAFRHLLGLTCRFRPLIDTTALFSAASWPDALQALYPALPHADPAPILATLAADDAARRDFLFSLFLPQRYGASFERYPLQAQWLADWLTGTGRQRPLRALDSACGSGEGTYRLAELLLQHGAAPGASVVHGATFEPVELFAAAHGAFPHAPRREAAFRERVAPLLAGGAPAIEFRLEDVATAGEGGYDVILVNGLLGGPMLPAREQVSLALERLSVRLAPGGVLLAADRFHEGWKRRLSREDLNAILEKHRLQPVSVGEGVGAVRPF